MKNTNTVWIIVAIAVALLIGGFLPLGFNGNTFWGWCANAMGYGGYGYGNMMGYGSTMGGFGFGWFFMLLVLVALALLIIWLVQQLNQKERKR